MGFSFLPGPFQLMFLTFNKVLSQFFSLGDQSVKIRSLSQRASDLKKRTERHVRNEKTEIGWVIVSVKNFIVVKMLENKYGDVFQQDYPPRSATHI